MRTSGTYVIGAGGHGRVVMEALLASRSGSAFNPCFADDNPLLQRHAIMNLKVFGPVTSVVRAGDEFHVAIGGNSGRQAMHERLSRLSATSVTIVHPRAVVSLFCKLGAGTFAAAGVIVGADSKVGEAVILNHGAVVDHGCTIGSFSHVAPNATLGGGVRVGEGVLIGAGANVLPEIKIADGAVIGAGAVVTRNVSKGTVVCGIPARRLVRK